MSSLREKSAVLSRRARLSRCANAAGIYLLIVIRQNTNFGGLLHTKLTIMLLVKRDMLEQSPELPVMR